MRQQFCTWYLHQRPCAYFHETQIGQIYLQEWLVFVSVRLWPAGAPKAQTINPQEVDLSHQNLLLWLIALGHQLHVCNWLSDNGE